MKYIIIILLFLNILLNAQDLSYSYSPSSYVGGFPGSNIEIKIVEFSSSTRSCSFSVRKADGSNFGSQVTIQIRKSSIDGPIIKTFIVPPGTNNSSSSSYIFENDFLNRDLVEYYSTSTISSFQHKAGPISIRKRLNTPILISPTNGAIGLVNPVPFDWNDVTNSSKYRIQISENNSFDLESGFLSPVLSDTVNASNYSWNSGVPGRTYFWSVRAGSETFYHSSFALVNSFTIAPGTNIIQLNYNLPSTFELSQNYPNPFNPSTKIRFAIPKESYVTLDVYNLLGQQIKTLYSNEMQAGNYIIDWDATDNSNQIVESGIYIVRMTSAGFSVSKKITFLK